MITAPAAYSTALAESSRAPIYAVALTDGTDTYRYVSDAPKNGGDFATAEQVLRPIRIRRSSDPRENRFTISEFVFDLYDRAGVVTADVGAIVGGFGGFECTFYKTFRELDWGSSEYVILYKGIVSDVPRYVDRHYRFTVRSAFARAIYTDLFGSESTTLLADMDATQTTAIVENASGWETPGSATVRDNLGEHFSYESVEDNGNGSWTLKDLTRGIFGSAQAHSAGETVAETLNLAGAYGYSNPLLLFRDMLTNTGRKTGIGLDSQWVDTAGFTAAWQKSINSAGAIFQFWFHHVQAQTAKSFIENQLLAPMSAYPVENNLGQIRPVLLDRPDVDDITETLTDDDIIERPDFHGAYNRRVNSVVCEYGTAFYSSISAPVLSGELPVESAGLIALTRGERYLERISWAGLATSSSSTILARVTNRANALFGRFGLAVANLSCRAMMRKELLEVGDVVACTFADAINMHSSSIGVSGLPFEIVEQEIDYTKSTIAFSLVGYPPLLTIDDGAYYSTSKVQIDGGGQTVIA